MLAKVLTKLVQLCGLQSITNDKLCQLVVSNKTYVVMCDTENNAFLVCIDNATGAQTVTATDGSVLEQVCTKTSRYCTTVTTAILSSGLQSVNVAGTVTAVPAGWATQTAEVRAAWFAGLLPAGYTYDGISNVCAPEGSTTSFSLNMTYDIGIRIFLWTQRTVVICTGASAPVGDLAPCIGPDVPDYEVTSTPACSDVHGNIDLVTISVDGVAGSTMAVVVDGGEVVTELGGVTSGYCDDSLEKLCDAANTAALQYDCLCGDGCREDLASPLVKVNNTFSVAATTENVYTLGGTVSFYDVSGNPLGTAVISGAATTVGGNLVFPVTDCSVTDADEPLVATVKPVLAIAARAAKEVAVKFAKRVAVKGGVKTATEKTATEKTAAEATATRG